MMADAIVTPDDLAALKATAEAYQAASAYVLYPHSTLAHLAAMVLQVMAELEAAQDTIERMRKHGVGAAALEGDDDE